MRRRPSLPSSVAYHEAGHAVASFFLRIPFRYLTLEPDVNALAHMKRGSFGRTFQPDFVADGRTSRQIQDDIVMTFAGMAAEARLTGRNNHVGASGDYAQAVQLASYVTRSNEELRAYLNWLAIKAKQFVAVPYHWAAIQALATVLLQKRRLGSVEARRIIQNAIKLTSPTD